MAIGAILGTILSTVSPLVGKFLTNKGDKAKFLAELELKLAEQETKLVDALTKSDVAQAEINKIDAQKKSFWHSGWRPSLAWVCVIGFVWNIFLPVVAWGLQLSGVDVPDIPTIGGEMLVSLTFGILGLGAYRTYEKKSGLTK